MNDDEVHAALRGATPYSDERIAKLDLAVGKNELLAAILAVPSVASSCDGQEPFLHVVTEPAAAYISDVSESRRRFGTWLAAAAALVLLTAGVAVARRQDIPTLSTASTSPTATPTVPNAPAPAPVVPPVSDPPLVQYLPCLDDHSDVPPDFTVVSDAVALPLSDSYPTSLQTAPSPEVPGLKLWAKSGLLYRPDHPFSISVPEALKGQLAISWDEALAKPVSTVVNTPCPAAAHDWAVLHGGYWVYRSMCATLLVTIDGVEKEVHIGIGEDCPGQGQGPALGQVSSRLEVPSTVVAGSTVSGELVIENPTGQPVRIVGSGCGPKWAVVLDSDAIPGNAAFTLECLPSAELVLPVGETRYAFNLSASFNFCAKETSTDPLMPNCTATGFPPLPAGRYRAKFFEFAPGMPIPESVSIEVTAS